MSANLSEPVDLRLLNARLAGRDAVIDIAAGRIAAIREPGESWPEAARSLDLGGRLVLPGFTDAHVHLDKCRLGLPWRPHRAAGSVRARIEDEKALRRAQRIPLAEQGAVALLERMLRSGTTSLRTHVDLDDVTGLDHLTQILDLRAQWAGRMRIEIVAFPQSGILSCPPAAGLLDEALRMGADLVGGLDPLGIDGEADAPLDIVFTLAERHGRGIDLHLHDGGEGGLREIEAIIARTEAAGLHGRVAISHGFALAEADDARLGRIAEAMARAGISLVTSVPGGPRCPPLPRLRESGVAVCFGTDNVRDAWNPASVTGMIDRAMLAAYRFDVRTDAALDALLDHATTIPARALGLGPGSVTPGAEADLAVFDASCPAEVVVERRPPWLVVAQGAVVA